MNKVYTVGEPSQQWQRDFWERHAERDTEDDFDASGKRTMSGETDTEYNERVNP